MPGSGRLRPPVAGALRFESSSGALRCSQVGGAFRCKGLLRGHLAAAQSQSWRVGLLPLRQAHRAGRPAVLGLVDRFCKDIVGALSRGLSFCVGVSGDAFWDLFLAELRRET